MRQELHFIEKVNKMVRGHGTTPLQLEERSANGEKSTRTYKEIKVFLIELEEEDVGVHLDTESKLDRNPRSIRRLFASGERQANRFLSSLAENDAMDKYQWQDDASSADEAG